MNNYSDRVSIGRFSFNTPYTLCGKAHGEVDEQYMMKTILTSAESFPYVKRRSSVLKAEKVGMNNVRFIVMCNYFVYFQNKINLIPLEVAILGMQDKIQSLRKILEQNPPDGKLLQMQLQGGVATAVNQVYH